MSKCICENEYGGQNGTWWMNKVMSNYETLPDLPLPAPKRLKRAAPEPEEPPVVQEVPKAELTGKMGRKSWANWREREREMKTMNKDEG